MNVLGKRQVHLACYTRPLSLRFEAPSSACSPFVLSDWLNLRHSLFRLVPTRRPLASFPRRRVLGCWKKRRIRPVEEALTKKYYVEVVIDRFGQSAGETSIIGLCNLRLLSYSTNEND